jgi:hypothetical protein
MMLRKRVFLTSAIVVAFSCVLAVGLVVGRQTAPAHSEAWIDANAVGYDEGVSVGRALQAGAALPAGTKDVAGKAFRAGYRSGLADSFGGYDGGWHLGRPYVVVLAQGAGDLPYRIAQRQLLQAGVTYRVCNNGAALCSS